MSEAFDNSLPEFVAFSPHWARLSQEDQTEFVKLHAHFRHQQKSPMKDRRSLTFAAEMTLVLKYIDRSPSNREERSMIAGAAFAGPFVCVNTRTLKCFLCRCKSSINGCFQQIGYISVRTKHKSKKCLISVLPSIEKDPTSLRQWTVRCAVEESLLCFVPKSPIKNLPAITDEDLYEEKKPQGNSQGHPKLNHIHHINSMPQINQAQQNNMQFFHPIQMMQQMNSFYQNQNQMMRNFQMYQQLNRMGNMGPMNYMNNGMMNYMNMNLNQINNNCIPPPFNSNMNNINASTDSFNNTSNNNGSGTTSPNMINSNNTAPVIISSQIVTKQNKPAPLPVPTIQPKIITDDIDLSLNDEHEQNSDYDLMEIPDITPSLSLDVITDFDSQYDFEDSVFFDGTRTMQRSQSAYISHSGFS